MEDKDDRLQFLIDHGRTLEGLPEADRNEANRIEGCQSMLWLRCELKEGRLYFGVDSDAVITKGIAGVLASVYSGATPSEILELAPDFLAEAGITQHLTPNRRNGLASVGERIREHARAANESTSHG